MNRSGCVSSTRTGMSCWASDSADTSPTGPPPTMTTRRSFGATLRSVRRGAAPCLVLQAEYSVQPRMVNGLAQEVLRHGSTVSFYRSPILANAVVYLGPQAPNREENTVDTL